MCYILPFIIDIIFEGFFALSLLGSLSNEVQRDVLVGSGVAMTLVGFDGRGFPDELGRHLNCPTRDSTIGVHVDVVGRNEHLGTRYVDTTTSDLVGDPAFDRLVLVPCSLRLGNRLVRIAGGDMCVR